MDIASPNIFLCNSANLPTGLEDYKQDSITLEYRSNAENQQNISLGLPNFIRQIYHLPDRILDLLEIATYIFSADRLVTRGNLDAVEYHSWSRKFHFVIKVRDLNFWQQSHVMNVLQEALTFMSGDESYQFTFQGGHKTPPTSIFDTDDFMLNEKEKTSICLFSGGLDSLSGTLKRLDETNEEICLVSYRSQNAMIKTQDSLFKAISDEYPDRLKHYTFKCNLKKTKAREETQRTRSFLFTAIAFAISYVLKQNEFFVYENGVTSLNLPKREGQYNARISRTTHPKTLGVLEKFYQTFAGNNFTIKNPYLFKSKTDVVSELVKLGHSDLITSSVSCGRGRMNFEFGTHCGGCSQCIDRRFAMYASKADKWDEASRIYDHDFITDAVTEHEARTTLIDFIRQARNFDGWNIEEFYDNYLTNLIDIIDFIPGKNEEEAVRKVFDLCDRHGKQISKAIKLIQLKHDDPFEEVPDDSLLDLIKNRPYLKTDSSIYDLVKKLKKLESGKEKAKEYEIIVEEILQKLFSPHLKDPHSQVFTHDQREIIDITFQNVADKGFWKDIKQRHGNVVVIFELKNMANLSNEEFHQIAGRLNKDKGLLGFLVARSKDGLDAGRAYRKLKDDKVILTLTDEDLIHMLESIGKDGSPTEHVGKLYRDFIEKA